MNNEFKNGIQLKIPKELMVDRYIEPSGLSREEAKKIALSNGVIWGCD